MRKARFARTLAGACVLAGGLAWTAVAGEAAPSPDRVRPLLIGADVPSVRVKQADGSVFDLQKAVTGKRSIIIFYRGGW